jgi:hypothetical protein
MRCAVLNGTSPRSMATRPKPPLCKSRSVTRSARSTGPSQFLFSPAGARARLIFDNLFSAQLKSCPSPSCSPLSGAPHRIHSSLSKSNPVAAAERGSRASVVSTRAHTSCRWVAAARAASSTQVRPEEAGPQISLRHPRGSPPVSASISSIPLETICCAGLTSSRDAEVTPASRGIAESRFKTSAAPSLAAKATGRPSAVGAQTSEEDIGISNFRERLYQRTSFREHRGGKPRGEFKVIFAFYSSWDDFAPMGKACQEVR